MTTETSIIETPPSLMGSRPRFPREITYTEWCEYLKHLLDLAEKRFPGISFAVSDSDFKIRTESVEICMGLQSHRFREDKDSNKGRAYEPYVRVSTSTALTGRMEELRAGIRDYQDSADAAAYVERMVYDTTIYWNIG